MNIEFKDPWNMMPLENAGKWINLVENSLDSSDLLFGKQIFVSGIHESKRLLLVDNDTDNSCAIVSIEIKGNGQDYICKTAEVIPSIEKLAARIKKDHEQWLSQWS